MSGPSLRAAHATPTEPLRFLDVGAGDGEETARLARLFGAVSATEVMCYRLSARGYALKYAPRTPVDVFPEDGAFNVMSCMNLLNHCDSLLRYAARRGAAGAPHRAGARSTCCLR